MGSNIQELLTQFDQVRKEMEEVVEATALDLEICPGWTIKDVLGNITAWEIVIHKALLAFMAGDPPYFLPEQDFDLFNRYEVEKRAGWTLSEVINERKQVRMDLKATILEMKEESLEEWMVLPWGSERTVRELLEIIEEHEQEHMEEVRRANEKR